MLLATYVQIASVLPFHECVMPAFSAVQCTTVYGSEHRDNF